MAKTHSSLRNSPKLSEPMTVLLLRRPRMLTVSPLALLLLVRGAAGEVSHASVTCTAPGACTVSQTLNSTAAACATYDTDRNLTSGFASLDVRTNLTHDPMLAAHAAGFAEATLTAREMAAFYLNVYEFGPEGPSAELVTWVEENDAWVRARAAREAANDDYWMAVALVLSQFDGILAGYASAAAALGLPSMSKLDLLWVNLDGDLFDLMSALGEASPRGRAGRARELYPQGLRCSALWKLTDENDELYFGHDTWDTYATAAPRIWKHVTLAQRRDGEWRARTASFSSSPGFLASVDDYYHFGESDDVSLIVIETSNNIFNASAYDALTPRSVLYWIRVMVAGALATSAPRWADLFSIEASGTYNNQWMLGDLVAFKPGRPLANGTFVVLEEVPGLIVARDQSATLQAQRYWPSFNVAFYAETRAIAGETESYTEVPRARLFSEMQGNVSDDASMRWLMGWNDYENDPRSGGSPDNAIMARGDLAGGAGGGIDSKFSSAKHIADGVTSFARAGPTSDDQPPFCWTKDFSSTPHAGHPQCFDFSWGSFSPAP